MTTKPTLDYGDADHTLLTTGWDSGASHYIQTTRILSTQGNYQIADKASLRYFSADEAKQVAERASKRNVFARHSYENNFYVQRIESLANSTIIEVIRPGLPDQIIPEAQKVAGLIECVGVLCSALTFSRAAMHKRMGISQHKGSTVDLTIGPDFQYLRTKLRVHPKVRGISVDTRFWSRFEKCGFSELLAFCQGTGKMVERVQLVLKWLYESRREPDLHAALVKTAIALESLLIFSESESLKQTLSERAAFIISPDSKVRRAVSQIVKKFYDARSGIVHGSQKNTKLLTPSLVEGMDRLVILLCLIVSGNGKTWESKEAIQEWCNTQRWGGPTRDIQIPFPKNHLTNAAKLCMKGLSS